MKQDNSVIQCSAWMTAFAGMTTLRYLVAGVIKKSRRQRRLDSLNGMAYWLEEWYQLKFLKQVNSESNANAFQKARLLRKMTEN